MSDEMLANEKKPLVTFALFAYNQEKYIREAVQGALSQTYSPLQIILSDDCSRDRTFEIMQEMAAQYSGPHEIILNRNEPNKGWAAHINHVMAISTGDLIIAAAGDDVSLPHRTKAVCDFYLKNGKPDSIFSDFHQINETGAPLYDRTDKPQEQTLLEFIDSPLIKGAAHAWTRRVFDIFGPLSDFVLCEDQTIPFRAYLLKKPRYIDEKLINYRRGSSRPDKYKFFLTHINRALTSRLQYLSDAKKSCADKCLIKKIKDEADKLETERVFWQSSYRNILKSAFDLCSSLGIKKATRWYIRRLACTRTNA